MYLVGTVYNFCMPHQSLVVDQQASTPAMAAGLTKHVWSVGELLCYPVAPLPCMAPSRRGRKPKGPAHLSPFRVGYRAHGNVTNRTLERAGSGSTTVPPP